jgi:glycosyltransferase involved in cell wall biosynthesis
LQSGLSHGQQVTEIVGYFPYSPGSNPYQWLFARSLEAAGCRVLRIPPRKLLPLRFAASHDVDLLQLDWPHDWYQGRSAWTRLLKRAMYADGLRRLRGIPVVWTVHNLHAHDAPDAAYEKRMIQALVDVCDGIIVLSRASEGLLRQAYAVAPSTRVELIHHGHYIGCYPNVVSRDEARRRLGLQKSGRIVLSLGRLQPYKGLEELITTFPQVAEPGDVLLLAGRAVSSEYGRHLGERAHAASRQGIEIVIRDTLVPDDELQHYFNACDVVALPFRQVLNSGSLLLAMSFGCPVVAPRLGSIPEVACPQGWFGYDGADPDGLHSALRAALGGRDLTGLRAAVMEFTEGRYDWREIGRKTVNLYSSILRHR